MDALALLDLAGPSHLILEERERLGLVIGVPHHAPTGRPSLPCPEHPDSDENTGLIGRHLADRLDCASIIACNATVDPNKHLDSGYTQQIVTWRPIVLIEIHGHGKVRSRYNFENSCGSARESCHSERLATAINRRLSGEPKLADLSVCGRFEDLYFRAAKTQTITDNRWLAYHIELSPM